MGHKSGHLCPFSHRNHPKSNESHVLVRISPACQEICHARQSIDRYYFHEHQMSFFTPNSCHAIFNRKYITTADMIVKNCRNVNWVIFVSFAKQIASSPAAAGAQRDGAETARAPLRTLACNSRAMWGAFRHMRICDAGGGWAQWRSSLMHRNPKEPIHAVANHPKHPEPDSSLSFARMHGAGPTPAPGATEGGQLCAGAHMGETAISLNELAPPSRRVRVSPEP